MDELLNMTPALFDESADTMLILQIDTESENQFLDRIGGKNARQRDLVAFVDQYAATGIGVLCFPVANEEVLPVWINRCRKVGLQAFLTIRSDQVESGISLDADGVVLDCRNENDFTCFEQLVKLHDDKQIFLLTTDANISVPKGIDGVIICAAEKECYKTAATENLLQADVCVFAGVYNFLCTENKKDWYPTSSMLNAWAVKYLAAGCQGVYLEGFCADVFDPDSALYDIYETCGTLSESVGSRRRHLYDGEFPFTILPGADWNGKITLGPVFDGAAVCLIIGSDATAENAFDVFVNDKQAEKTGTPVVTARNEQGKECENGCIPGFAKCNEFFVENGSDDTIAVIRVHNNTNKPISVCWLEMTVNI